MRIYFVVGFFLSLSGCASTPPKAESPVTAQIFEFPQMPVLSGAIRLGGFSGLSFEGRDEKTGVMRFMTHTDRGPNLDSVEDKKLGEVRPFSLPQFHPEWVRFTFEPNQGLKIKERIILKGTDGHLLTGLPNLVAGPLGDETPVDLKHQLLKRDPQGLDLEALVRDTDGTYWMGEEYRPSVLHFSAQGKLLSRWIPKGNDVSLGLGQPVLPEHYRRRQMNRGFEGLALHGDFVFAFLQSGLDKQDEFTRILKIDKRGGQPIAEYLFAFEPKNKKAFKRVDKIGDAVALSETRFLVIEQNGATGGEAFRRLVEIDLSKASNILDTQGRSPDLAKVSTATKKTVADLTELGFRDVEKAEGLTLIDDHTVAIVNDNDFGVNSPSGQSPAYFLLLHLP